MTLCTFFRNLLKKSDKQLDFPYVGKMGEIHYTEVKNWRWPNFSRAEIACKQVSKKGNCYCGGSIVIDEHSMDCLQRFRNIVGIPFSPNSAYRCAVHNRNVGGSPNSQHLLGRAFDIPIKKGMDRATIHRAAKKAGFTGFGDYDNFVHVDTGPARYWDERK